MKKQRTTRKRAEGGFPSLRRPFSGRVAPTPSQRSQRPRTARSQVVPEESLHPGHSEQHTPKPPTTYDEWYAALLREDYEHVFRDGVIDNRIKIQTEDDKRNPRSKRTLLVKYIAENKDQKDTVIVPRIKLLFDLGFGGINNLILEFIINECTDGVIKIAIENAPVSSIDSDLIAKCLDGYYDSFVSKAVTRLTKKVPKSDTLLKLLLNRLKTLLRIIDKKVIVQLVNDYSFYNGKRLLLNIAVKQDRQDIVKTLLELGANPLKLEEATKLDEQFDAVSLAFNNRNLKLFRLIIETCKARASFFDDTSMPTHATITSKQYQNTRGIKKTFLEIVLDRIADSEPNVDHIAWVKTLLVHEAYPGESELKKVIDSNVKDFKNVFDIFCTHVYESDGANIVMRLLRQMTRNNQPRFTQDYTDICMRLLQHGNVNVDLQDNEGITALMLAADVQNVLPNGSLFNMLLTKAKDSTILLQDKNGNTVLMKIINNEMLQLCDEMYSYLQKPLKLSLLKSLAVMTNVDGETMFHIAFKKDIKVLEFWKLLGNEPSYVLQPQNKSDKPPLKLAKNNTTLLNVIALLKNTGTHIPDISDKRCKAIAVNDADTTKSIEHFVQDLYSACNTYFAKSHSDEIEKKFIKDYTDSSSFIERLAKYEDQFYRFVSIAYSDQYNNPYSISYIVVTEGNELSTLLTILAYNHGVLNLEKGILPAYFKQFTDDKPNGYGIGASRNILQKAVQQLVSFKIFVETEEDSGIYNINENIEKLQTIAPCFFTNPSIEPYEALFQTVGKLVMSAIINKVKLPFHLNSAILAHILYGKIPSRLYALCYILDYPEQGETLLNYLKYPSALDEQDYDEDVHKTRLTPIGSQHSLRESPYQKYVSKENVTKYVQKFSKKALLGKDRLVTHLIKGMSIRPKQIESFNILSLDMLFTARGITAEDVSKIVDSVTKNSKSAINSKALTWLIEIMEKESVFLKAYKLCTELLHKDIVDDNTFKKIPTTHSQFLTTLHYYWTSSITYNEKYKYRVVTNIGGKIKAQTCFSELHVPADTIEEGEYELKDGKRMVNRDGHYIYIKTGEKQLLKEDFYTNLLIAITNDNIDDRCDSS